MTHLFLQYHVINNPFENLIFCGSDPPDLTVHLSPFFFDKWHHLRLTRAACELTTPTYLHVTVYTIKKSVTLDKYTGICQWLTQLTGGEKFSENCSNFPQQENHLTSELFLNIFFFYYYSKLLSPFILLGWTLFQNFIWSVLW